jgi:hypothetical protein
MRPPSTLARPGGPLVSLLLFAVLACNGGSPSANGSDGGQAGVGGGSAGNGHGGAGGDGSSGEGGSDAGIAGTGAGGSGGQTPPGSDAGSSAGGEGIRDAGPDTCAPGADACDVDAACPGEACACDAGVPCDGGGCPGVIERCNGNDECGNGADEEDGFAILQVRCGGAVCHGAGSAVGSFAASEADALSYVGLESNGICAGSGVVINPEDPEGSLLIRKLRADPPCGSRMPLGSTLSDQEITCLESWMRSL